MNLAILFILLSLAAGLGIGYAWGWMDATPGFTTSGNEVPSNE